MPAVFSSGIEMNLKLFLKGLKLSAIVLTAILTILFILSLLFQEKAGRIILNILNSNFSTKIETGPYRLSLIRKFPKATVELKNVLVHSSPDFNKKNFQGINTDTLLYAKSVSIDFKLIDLLKGAYTFKRINIKNGRLYLLTDKEGKDNYDVSAGKKEGKTGALNFDRINLENIYSVYDDRNAELQIEGPISNGWIKSRIKGSNIDFDTKSELIIHRFCLGSASLDLNIPAIVDLSLRKNSKGVFFSKAVMEIDDWNFILSGYIASDNYLDLKVEGKNIDISQFAEYFPGKYHERAAEYGPSGILKLESIIKGTSSRTQDPYYEISWSLKNARIAYRKANLKVDGLSFDGFISNGEKSRPETGVFRVDGFKARLGSAEYNGSFIMNNFRHPSASLDFKGTLFPDELKKFLGLSNIEEASGSVSLDIKLSGDMPVKEKFRINDILYLNSRSEMNFNSMSLKFANRNLRIENMTGGITFMDKTVVKDFHGTLNDQDFIVDGELTDFPEWLFGEPVTLAGWINIKSPSVMPENLMKNENTTGTSGSAVKAINLPDDANIDITLDFESLVYKKFRSEQIKSSIQLEPGKVNFKSVDIHTQKGTFSGSGFLARNMNKSFMARGNFTFDNIDINEAFETFNNFGQGFIKAENLEGLLSGTLSVLIPTDSLLHPDVKSLTAEGKFFIINGALINFEPVRALSSFIELSELRNIKFEKLENDFFIRNNVFNLPQMDVRSSAVDLAVSGRHGFDNTYEYHVRMLLSELLSSKARRNKKISEEFGEIQDDGLGRTSVFLKINGSGDDIKVSYDMKAAGNQIKNDIRKERETLKKIFDEEYGNEPVIPSPGEKTTQGKPRFRITWEEADTLKTEDKSDETVPVKKNNILRELFRRKRN